MLSPTIFNSTKRREKIASIEERKITSAILGNFFCVLCIIGVMLKLYSVECGLLEAPSLTRILFSIVLAETMK
jgi:hypothetical protein